MISAGNIRLTIKCPYLNTLSNTNLSSSKQLDKLFMKLITFTIIEWLLKYLKINIKYKIGGSTTSSVFKQRKFPSISTIRSYSLWNFLKYLITSTVSLDNSHCFYVLSFHFVVVLLVSNLILSGKEELARNCIKMIIYYSVYLKYIAFAFFLISLPIIALIVLKIIQKFTVGRVTSLACLKGKTAIITGGGSGKYLYFPIK